MKNIECRYLEKYSEELDSIFNSYIAENAISEEISNELHLEICALFNQHLEQIMHDFLTASLKIGAMKAVVH
jgi:hypothetical protein